MRYSFYSEIIYNFSDNSWLPQGIFRKKKQQKQEQNKRANLVSALSV